MFDRAGSRKYLNANERGAFLAWVNDLSVPSDKAFCLTMFYTGCRISEALNLTGNRVDVSQNCVVFETLKRRKAGEFRSVPVPEILTKMLAELAAQTGPSERIWLFSRSTAYRMIKDGMLRAGVLGGMCSPKGLRHGFAVACITKNIALPTVKKWMGHSRLETTAIYLGVTGEEERVLAARLWS